MFFIICSIVYHICSISSIFKIDIEYSNGKEGDFVFVKNYRFQYKVWLLIFAIIAFFLFTIFVAFNFKDSITEQFRQTNTLNCDKKVYLTFDDGPSKNTEKILDILKKYDIKATFFVIQKDDFDEKELMRRIVDEGHSIGVHTYTHNYNKIYDDMDGFVRDFEKIENFIYENTGATTNLYRFPGGSTNHYIPSKRLFSEMVAYLDSKKYIYFDWNIVSGDDTSTVYPAEVLANNVLKKINKQQESVVLFHDAALCKTTPDAIEIIIQTLIGEGYVFDKLTQESPKTQFVKRK